MPKSKPSTDLTWAGVCEAVYYAAAMWATKGQYDPYYWTMRKRTLWLRRHMAERARVARAVACAVAR